jgi:hypothetical protein
MQANNRQTERRARGKSGSYIRLERNVGRKKVERRKIIGDGPKMGHILKNGR